MSDLISRSALLKIFNHDLKCFETNGKTEAEMYISVADMRKMINGQPTAYDVEKVVEEIADLNHFNIQLADKMLDIQKSGKTHRHYICAEDAIGIVRKGGIDG